MRINFDMIPLYSKFRYGKGYAVAKKKNDKKNKKTPRKRYSKDANMYKSGSKLIKRMLREAIKKNVRNMRMSSLKGKAEQCLEKGVLITKSQYISKNIKSNINI